MSPGTMDDCCCAEYKATYEFVEAAVRAANEYDVALKDLEIYKEMLKTNHEIDDIKNIIDNIETVTAIGIRAFTMDARGTVIDCYKAIGELFKWIEIKDLKEKLGKLELEKLENLAQNLQNKREVLDDAIKKCRKLFMNLLECTAKYEPKTVSLNLTWSEDHTTSGDIRVGHLKNSIKCQAQLERKAPSLTEDFYPWFEYFRKSPKMIGDDVRDLVCTYVGEVQANIMVDEFKPFIFLLRNSFSGNPLSIGVVGDAEILIPQFHDVKTEIQGGPITIRFYFLWSRFRPCEPLKFNVIFNGEEKLHITCYLESTCFSRIDDLVFSAQYCISYVTGGGVPASLRKLPLISDPIRGFPHKWIQKLEKVNEYPGSVFKYALEISVESRS